MKLRGKVVTTGVGLIAITGAALSAVHYREARQQVVQQYVEKARSIVLSAESTREEMGRKWDQKIFTAALVREWADRGEREKVLSVVPVVTAWRAAAAKSEEGGYTFRVPKFQPRNPKNEPDAVEARVLTMFENENIAEHFEIDPTRNAIRYFRPIRLTQECLLCHGDPAQSKTVWGRDDGRDPTGGVIEGWRVGEVHGAFEIEQSLHEADARMRASLGASALMVLLPAWRRSRASSRRCAKRAISRRRESDRWPRRSRRWSR